MSEQSNSEPLTAPLKLMQLIIFNACGERYDTAEDIRDSYPDWEGEDAACELRCGEVETGLPSEKSRHYESKAVAAKMLDGSWVGWTYWYGGGKHGEPAAVPWVEHAYDLDVTETEKLVVVREFKVRQEGGSDASE